MSIALPLPVGIGSICELMDIGVAMDKLPEGTIKAINKTLPEGLSVVEVYTSGKKFSSIEWIGISGMLYYDADPPPDIVERLSECFSKESIVIAKKTKSGISDLDIRPFIREVCIGKSHEVTISAKISAQNPSINHENLMSAIKGGFEPLIPDFYDFTRTEVFDKDMNVFS